MSDIRLKPELIYSMITFIETNGQSVIIWAQNDVKSTAKLDTLMDNNYRLLFHLYYREHRTIERPIIGKYYVFCDKEKYDFYRVYVYSSDLKSRQSVVTFIDFGYSEEVSNDRLFVFDGLFFDCKPLAVRYELSDIRPKDRQKGWESTKVVDCLQKFLRSMLFFAIIDHKIKVYDNNNKEVIIERLLNVCEEEITYETSCAMNASLFAIEYNINDNSRQSVGHLDQTIESIIESKEHSILSISSYSSVDNIDKTEVTVGLKDKCRLKITNDLRIRSELKVTNDLKDNDSTGITGAVIPQPMVKSPTISFINGSAKLIDLNESAAKVCRSGQSCGDKVDGSTHAKYNQSIQSFLMKLAFGLKRKAIILKTLTEKSVYISLCEYWDLIEGLTSKLNEYYNEDIHSNRCSLNANDLEVGAVVAALYSVDQLWYRASVVDISADGSEAKVLYLDYGNSERVDTKYMKKLMPQFYDLTPQAIHCRPLNEGLSAETLEMYETQGLEIDCEFVALNDSTLDVKLYDNCCLLKDSVVGVADTTGVSLEKVSIIDNQCSDSDLMAESEATVCNRSEFSFKSYPSMTTIDVNPKVAVTPVVSLGKVSINDNQCSNSDLMAGSEATVGNRSELSFNSYPSMTTIDVSPETKDYYENLCDVCTTVLITCVADSTSFYCQIYDDMKALDGMVDTMTKYYNNATGLELNESDLQSKRQWIAVYYSLEAKWWRAYITSRKELNEVQVFYIDYGVKEVVDLDSCKRLLKVYCDLMPQAIHCRPVRKCNSYALKQWESHQKPLKVQFGCYIEATNSLDVKIIDKEFK